MSTPLAGKNLGDVARHYIARIGSIYDRARELLAGDSVSNSGSLDAWKWYRASAQACMEEAAIIYTEGLESLIKVPVRVDCHRAGTAPQFTCLVAAGDTPAAADSGFRVGRKVIIDTDAERDAITALLGSTERHLLDAFAEGLCKLQLLGAFGQQRSIALNPEPASEWKSALTGKPEVLSDGL